MHKRDVYWMLGILMVVTLAIRLYIALQTPYFTGDEAYFHLRQIEHIKQTGLPLIQDQLSFNGRTHLFLPTYDYILALGSFYNQTIALKFITNLFAVSMMFVMFLVVNHLTNREIALLSSFISGFVPIFFSQTVNSLTIYSLVIPLTFLALYFFMKRSANAYLITLLVLIMLHPSVIVLLLTLLAYLLFLSVEKIQYDQFETELCVFSLFFSLWFYFIVYKKALLAYGGSIIWNNIPLELLGEYFLDLNMLTLLTYIGIIPLIFGFFVMYQYVSSRRDKDVYLFISMALVLILLLWFKLIQFTIGLMYVGIVLVILFSVYYKQLIKRLELTKFASYVRYLFICFIILFMVTSVFPTLHAAQSEIELTIDPKEVTALRFLETITGDDEVFFATYEDGSTIQYFAHRPTVVDRDFLLINDIAKRSDDVHELFTTRSITKAQMILNDYNAKYIYVSDAARLRYNITDLSFIDEECFKLYFAAKVNIYENVCLK